MDDAFADLIEANEHFAAQEHEVDFARRAVRRVGEDLALEYVERALGHVDGRAFVGDVRIADRDEHDVLGAGDRWVGS